MFPHVTDDRGLGHKRACKPLQKTANLIDEPTQPSIHRQASIYNPNYTTTTPNFTINPTPVIRTGFTRPEFKHFQGTVTTIPLPLYAK